MRLRVTLHGSSPHQGTVEVVDGARRGAWWELASGSSAAAAGPLGGRWQLAQEWAVPAQNERGRRKYGSHILYFEPLDAAYHGVVLCVHGGEATTVENAAPAQHVLELDDRALQSLVRMIGAERPVLLELRAAGFFARLFGRRRRSRDDDGASDLAGDDATVPFLLSSTTSSNDLASEAPFQGHGGHFGGAGADGSWGDGHDTRAAALPLIVDPFASDGGHHGHHGGHDSSGHDAGGYDAGGYDPGESGAGGDWDSSDGSTSY
jgi:hypothetical protein